jgi:cell division transport system permease protein
VHGRWQQWRKLLAPQLDIPFSKDDVNRFLPWFIALMVFLAGLFLAVGITVTTVIQHKEYNISDWVTVQLPAVNVRDKLTQEATALLQSHPDVAQVRRLKDEQISEMLSPWFGAVEDVMNLPYPRLLEVELRQRDEESLEALKVKLADLHPEISLDDHQLWIDHYLSFLRLLSWAAYLLAALIVSATCLMIIFTSKTALKLHYDAVWLLHSVGAVDAYIASQFQFNAFLLGMRGALIGTTLAASCFFTLGIFTSHLDASLLPSLPITEWHLLLWLLLPILTGVIAMVATRHTVLSMLHRMV